MKVGVPAVFAVVMRTYLPAGIAPDSEAVVVCATESPMVRVPVFPFTDDWTEDAARRDFTINALSADPDGLVHDPFGGSHRYPG